MAAGADEVDEALAEAAAEAWEGISEEIVDAEAWLLDPSSKVTRTAMVLRLRDFGGMVLRRMLQAVYVSNLRLLDVRDEVRDECEEVLGSEHDRVGIRERYATALRVLEDAKIDEMDIVGAARQSDPLAFMRKQRGIR